MFSLSRYLWRELWAGYFGTAPHATGHTLPLGTGTKWKQEAFRSEESPNHTRSPKRASKSTPTPSQKHQRAASLCRRHMEQLWALALLTGSLPKTSWSHQVTLDSQINSSSSPPTLSWQFVKDRVFIKKTNAEWVILVGKRQTAPCADKQSGEEDDSLLGYFYQHYSRNPLPIVAGTSPLQEGWGTRQQQWNTSQEVFYIFRDRGKEDRCLLALGCCMYVQRKRRDDQKQTRDFAKPLSSFLEQRPSSFVIPQR